MKTLLKYSVFALAIAIPAALSAHLVGLPFSSPASLEVVLAAFASAGIALIVVCDYSYRRQRDLFTSCEPVLDITPERLPQAYAAPRRRRVASLTASR